eukprot:gene18758-20649_t
MSGLFEDAIHWHNEELNFSQITDDVTAIAISHRKIGECCCELGQFSKALRHQKKQLALARSISNCVEEQRALATIGRTLFVQSDDCEREIDRERCLSESQDAYLKSLALCDSLRNTVSDKEILEMKARLCLNLGLVYEWRNNLNQAERFMERALISSRENNLKENMYRCYLSLAGVTAKNNMLQESLRHAKRAQHLAKEKRNNVMEADAILQIGQALLKLGEFSAAIQVFRQSFKLNRPELESEFESFTCLVKLASRGKKYVEKLKSCTSDEDMFTLYEKLGDVYGEAKSPLKALEYYEKQLSLAKRLNKKNVASIYVSLAITHAENRDVEKALEYYHKELEIRTQGGLNKDFKETCATYSAIAKLQEDNGHDVNTIKETYLKALECARKSGSITCQIRVSKELSETLQKFSLDEEFKQLQRRIGELEDAKGESDEDDDSSQNIKEEEDEEDIEYLLAPSDSSDEETAGSRRKSRSSKKKLNDPNDKGETPLHVACINGNTSRVQELLEKGASVHVRDHCGWLPLHEACNFGHVEIVKLLIAYGANVNDPGGSHCGRITPLHDAAQNGHFETVKFLIKSNADPFYQDAKGRTALDAVEKAIQADEDELEDSDSDLLNNRRNVRKYLKEIMAKRKPIAQLRNRSTIERDLVDEDDSDDDIEDSEEHEHDARYKLSCKIAKAQERGLEYAGSLANRGRRSAGVYTSEATSSRPGSAANGDSEERSLDMNQANTQNLLDFDPELLDGDIEMIGTDNDSTYASMDENGMIDHSPLRPLEPLSQAVVHPITPLPNSPINTSCDTMDQWQRNTRQGSSNRGSFVPDRVDLDEGSGSDSDFRHQLGGFIVDDVGGGNQQQQLLKRRRIDVSARRKPVQSKLTVATATTSGMSSRNKKLVGLTTRRKHRRQTRITHAYSSVVSNNASSDRGFCVNTTMSSNSTLHGASRLNAVGNDYDDDDDVGRHDDIASFQQRRSASASESRLMRVRVRVEKELLLIPCADSNERRTIDWLADQASQRYSSTMGMCPKLSLKTKEGAMLCPRDYVSDVLMNNEEVHSVITGWDAGLLHEKYENECAILKLKKRADILEMLSLGDSLSQMKMIDSNLKPKDIGALSKAITGHTRLAIIDFTGSHLGTNGVASFCSALHYLPNLTSLNLTCTGLTAKDFALLSEALSLRYQPGSTDQHRETEFHPLEELDCSFNCFGDGAVFLQSLKEIGRKCLRLKILRLDHCHINTSLQTKWNFEANSKAFGSLQTLALAGNSGVSFIDRLLPRVSSTIQDLDLSADSLHDERFVDSLLELITNIYKSPRCSLHNLSLREINLEKSTSSFLSMLNERNFANVLQRLDISGSNFKDDYILKNIATIHSLRELDLSRNDELDSENAEHLIQCLAASKTSISKLTITSCDIQSLSGDFISNLEQCEMLSYLDLSFNDIPYQDKIELADWWKQHHVNGLACIEGDFCILSADR